MFDSPAVLVSSQAEKPLKASGSMAVETMANIAPPGCHVL